MQVSYIFLVMLLIFTYTKRMIKLIDKALPEDKTPYNQGVHLSSWPSFWSPIGPGHFIIQMSS